jgi:hypothetical protein
MREAPTKPKKTAALPPGYDDEAAFIKEARERFQSGVDFDRMNRDQGLEDLKFLAGEQWDPDAIALRQGRPMLTINTLPQHVAQVVGDLRINPPAIKVRPSKGGTKDLAEVREGLIRAIEQESDAQGVYISAGTNQTACGIGNFRVGLKYETEDGFDRDITIEHIPNAFAVVWDPKSTERTGKDASWCFVDDEMPRKAYEKRYGTVGISGLEVPLHDLNGWFQTDSVRVTEYWIVKETPVELALLDSGDVVDADKVPKGAKVVRKRKSERKSACVYLINGVEILEGPIELPINRLPILRVQGWEVVVGTRRIRWGLVRMARDAQRLKNYWRSVSAEMLALAPKGKWLLQEQQDGEQDEFRDAVTADDPVLTYSGQVKPEYIGPPTLNSAVLQESALNAQDIKDVTGQHDASLGAKSNETSGKAIMARQREGDTATYIYVDNLHAAIEAAGDVIDQLIPKIYDTAREVRILGEDMATKVQAINDPANPDSLDINQGRYDVVVEAGPSYATKRIEASESMMQFVQAVPSAAQVSGDLIAQAQDWPMADKIAERLKATLPPQVLMASGDEQTPEEQQRVQQAQQMAVQQSQMQQQHGQLTLQELDAKVKKTQAEANHRQAEADRLSSGMNNPDPMVQQIEQSMKAAQLRLANAQADKAEAESGIAYAQLAMLTNPEVAEAKAMQTVAQAHQAAAQAAQAHGDLAAQPLDTAHSIVDLNTKLNPPEPAEAEPAQEQQPAQ